MLRTITWIHKTINTNSQPIRKFGCFTVHNKNQQDLIERLRTIFWAAQSITYSVTSFTAIVINCNFNLIARLVSRSRNFSRAHSYDNLRDVDCEWVFYYFSDWRDTRSICESCVVLCVCVYVKTCERLTVFHRQVWVMCRTCAMRSEERKNIGGVLSFSKY